MTGEGREGRREREWKRQEEEGEGRDLLSQ
jgi:hypothetical protein